MKNKLKNRKNDCRPTDCYYYKACFVRRKLQVGFVTNRENNFTAF